MGVLYVYIILQDYVDELWTFCWDSLETETQPSVRHLLEMMVVWSAFRHSHLRHDIWATFDKVQCNQIFVCFNGQWGRLPSRAPLSRHQGDLRQGMMAWECCFATLNTACRHLCSIWKNFDKAPGNTFFCVLKCLGNVFYTLANKVKQGCSYRSHPFGHWLVNR